MSKSIEEKYAEWQRQRKLLDHIDTDVLVHELFCRCRSASDGYFAAKFWHTDDLKDTLDALGYATTDENVRNVLSAGQDILDELWDVQNEEWDMIEEAVRRTSGLEKKH